MRVRRLRKRGLTGKAGSRQIIAQHVLERHDVRGRFDPVDVHLGKPVDMVEDGRKLAGQTVDLPVGQPEPGKPGHMEYLFTLDHAAESS